MTQQEKQKKLDRIWDSVRMEIGNSTWDLIQEAVELEIELSREDGR
jgi:hypothetical protein